MTPEPAASSPLETLRAASGSLKAWASFAATRGQMPRGGREVATSRPEADAAVEGRLWFRFNGHQEVETGRRGIDWSAGHIRHQEWRAQLHRFFFLVPLANAFRETGDRRYAEAARDYLEDWLRANPVENGVWTPRIGTTMEIAIRVGSVRFGGWLRAIEVFGGQAPFDAAFLDTLFENIRAQLAYLENHVTALGNWRMCEADTLLAAGLLLPWLEESARWRAFGVELINEGFLKQVLPDGAHYELTPGYHHWMTGFFFTYWELSRVKPELGLDIPTEKLAAMFDYGEATFRPDGLYNAWNDSQAIGSLKDRLFSGYHARFRELTGERPPHDGFFPWARQAALRDGEGPQAWYLTFEGAAGVGSHSHLGRNSVSLMAYGKPLVVDSGHLTYEVSDPAMAYGRSTRAHNTLNLNGWNQTLAPCSEFRRLSVPGADLLLGRYEAGYWEGEYGWKFADGLGRGRAALHHRTVFWMHGVGVLVVDQLVRHLHGNPEPEIPTLEQNWQFATPDLVVEREAGRVRTRQEGANLLALFPTLDAETTMRVHCGEKGPVRGWLPSDHGLQPAAQLCLSRPLPGQYAEWVTLLIPYPGENAPEVRCRIGRPDPTFLTRLELEWGDGTADEITWVHRFYQPIGRCGFHTDAPLVWQRTPAGEGCARVTHFGSRFEPDPTRPPVIVTGCADYWSR